MIECVPNFSEGKRLDVIKKIVVSITAVAGVKLLDQESDPNHNRSVITFAGETEAVKTAAFNATATAMKLIDLTKHKGEHPRVGATDVIPFIPLTCSEPFGKPQDKRSESKDSTMKDCVRLAEELGKRIGEELQIPVYLYEEAARRPDRKNLADIRRGEFEGLRAELGKNQARNPDFGPERIHPTAGATVVGARFFLIAYNINLNTPDINIAKTIARRIRASSGGLPAVKALGVFLADKSIVQVTMNLTNYRVTGMKTVFEAVKQEATRLGISIRESELIGLLPAEALVGTSPQELLMTNFNEQMIIENRLRAI